VVVDLDFYIAEQFEIQASFTSMTRSNVPGGRWIFGKQVGVNDIVAIPINEINSDYVVPWCTSYDCCNKRSYNGMSISRHETENKNEYRLHITGGLSGGSYWTTGQIIIPEGWSVKSISGSPGREKEGAFCKVEGNKVLFKCGLNYRGCICSDCGRANIDIIVKRDF
jgi:hypothetical protein